jgi:2-isopropylmalate synthase
LLTARSGRAALKHRLELLGFEIDKEKLNEIYEEFVKLADKKKDINDDDIALLVGDATRKERRIKLDYLQVVTGKELKPMATVRLDISGEKFDATSAGNGPVDAAIKAVKQIIHRQIIIEEFLVQAITRGSDDIGKVHMQVQYEDMIYHGFGAHTDIITASVEAFLDAVNKLPIAK